LITGAAAMGSLTALGALARAQSGPLRGSQRGALGARPDTLVLVELKGGNDGLNTIAPVRDPLYRRARPELALAEKDALGFAPGVWLHPALAPLAPAVEAGELAAVLNVGYAKPNRSHFRSIEIWDQACGADEILDEGWCARALHASGFDRARLAGVLLDSDSGPLAGARTLGVDDDDELARLATRAQAPVPAGLTPAAQRIVALRADVQAEAARLSAKLAGVRLRSGAFTNADGGRGAKQVRMLETVARVVLADVGVPVVKLTVPGFDTHRDQAKTQARLLGALAHGLASLRATLLDAGAWQRVVVVVTSEFGRRVKENGNGGTDHGAACPVLVLGGGVKGGAHGSYRLDDLLDGDLRAATPHKDVFAAIARRVFGDAGADSLAPSAALSLFA
jgi:uncharacterized protein (DUF1501 family)